jgi:hypothetical protein
MDLARDPHLLGVALRRIVVCQGTEFTVLLANDLRPTDGLQAYGADKILRWMDNMPCSRSRQLRSVSASSG